MNTVLSKSDTSASPSSSLDINESNISVTVTSNENVTVTVIPASGLKGEEIKISAKITSPPHQRPMFAKAYLHLDREEEEVKGDEEGDKEEVYEVMLADFDMDGTYNGTWRSTYFVEVGIYYIDITATSMKGEKKEFKNVASVEIWESLT